MSETIRLLDTDWDAPGGAAEVEREYPVEPVQEFMNKMRRNRHQWATTPGIITIWMRQLNEALDGHAQQQKEAQEKEARHRAQTEKARRTLAEKRAAAAA